MAEERSLLLENIQDLIESGNRQALRDLLADERPPELAEVVELLDPDEQRVVFDLADAETAADILLKVDEATRAELIELLGEDELTRIIAELDADDAADVLGELPPEQSLVLLDQIASEHATQIKDLMGYSEDSAGGIMDPIVVSVQEDATLGEAVERIRKADVDEDFFSIFVVDKVGRFVGDVRIRSLITRPATSHVRDLLDRDTVYVQVDADQEEVRNIFRRHDLVVVPVLDGEHKLVGRITADRVIEVAEEEAAEDLYAMAGTDAAELENFSAFNAARVRLTWLLPCLLGTGVTAIVALYFQHLYAGRDLFPVWATAMAFTPMIAAISGNAGLQTSAIVITGLATGDLAALQIRQVVSREVRIAMLVALGCGLIGGVLTIFLPSLISVGALATADGSAGSIQAVQAAADGPQAGADALPPEPVATPPGPAEGPQAGIDTSIRSPQLHRIVAAFSISMFTAIMVSTTLGLFLPFLFRRVGIDPAIASGPLVTTANDSISVAIYLTLTLTLSTL